MYLPDQQGSIGVFDSGIGGLSVANAISGLLPRESMLYFADNARAPYGPRSVAEILDFSRRITDFLLAAGVKMIVVACNTATSAAIDDLRSEYPHLPFVGLEPAVKPAANGQRVGVIATEATLNSTRYLALKEKYLGGREVWENCCRGLVPLIETHGAGTQVLRNYLEAVFTTAGDLDTLVLGCTHYPLIEEDIRSTVGEGVNIINPSTAAARQVARLLEKHNLAATGEQNTVYDFACSGSTLPLQRTLLTLENLNGGRRLLTSVTATSVA